MHNINLNPNLDPARDRPYLVLTGATNLQEPDPLPPDVIPENPQLPLPQPQMGLWAKFWKDKIINIPIILMIALCIFDFVPIFCGVVHSFRNRSPYLALKFKMPRPLQYISADLKADPIIDIQIMDKGSICPSGFQILNLGTWPGTKEGCICEDGELKAAFCGDVDSPSCKKDLPQNYPIRMFQWDDSIWCVKKAVFGKDYLRKAECPSGYKECYVGGCFAKDCPVTKVEITSTGAATNRFNNSKEDRYLTVTKAQGELPLINIQMTFGDVPCFIQDLFSQTIKNSTYELSAIKNKGCDKYGVDDTFSTTLASQPAYYSYKQNSFPYPIMHLPYFEDNANKTVSILSAKVRMRTAKYDYCQSVNEDFLDDYISSTVILDVVSITCYVFLFELRLAGLIIPSCSTQKSSRDEFFDDSTYLAKVYSLTSGLSLILVMPLLVSFQTVSPVFQAAKGYAERYETLGCFHGDQASLVINDCLENLRIIEAGFWTYPVLFWSTVFSCLMCFWVFIVKRKFPQYN